MDWINKKMFAMFDQVLKILGHYQNHLKGHVSYKNNETKILFFTKKYIVVLYIYPVFTFLLDHHCMFLHFFFHFNGPIFFWTELIAWLEFCTKPGWRPPMLLPSMKCTWNVNPELQRAARKVIHLPNVPVEAAEGRRVWRSYNFRRSKMRMKSGAWATSPTKAREFVVAGGNGSKRSWG